MGNSIEIKFSTKSMVDDFGRVFFYKDKVYRAIYKNSINNCIELLESNLFQELTLKGLIPKTFISNFELTDFELVLEHEVLSEIQQHEWSFEMFKRAALTVLKINKICQKYGYELKDAHTFNVLFRGTEPVYVDLGSISKIENNNEWIAYKEFYCVFYLPLVFWTKKEVYIVRKLVESNFYKMQTAPFQDMLDSKLMSIICDDPFKYKLQFRRKIILKNCNYSKIVNKVTNILNQIISIIKRKETKVFKYEQNIYKITPENEIENVILNLNYQKRISEWDSYHVSNYSNNNIFSPSKRFLRIIEHIKNIEKDVDSVVDLAGNEGFFTKLIAENTNISKIRLVDYDSNAIDVAYNMYFNSKLNRVSVSVLNFIFTLDIENTINRYKSDLVIALAVTHHLILTQKYSLDVVLERLEMYTNKYVFVEFMPLGLWSINTRTGVKPPEWYTFDWFKLKFEKYFDLLNIETLEENRILFIGKKK